MAFDPAAERIVRRFPMDSAKGGTAFDGARLYQLSRSQILVIDADSGEVLRRLAAPGEGCSGMAWADGYLWVGQWSGRRILKVDAQTGEVVKTLGSDRFVTGVSCLDGALWHGAAGDDGPSELRRLAPDGTVDEVVSVPVRMIAGVERTPDGDFWCAGEEGTLRLIRRRAG